MAFWGLCELLGGIAIFITGLKLIAQNFGSVLGGNLKKWIQNLTGSRCLGVLLGAGTTSLMQSSVAVNMLVISLVESSVITLAGACAVIIGTNIGTTITAQLVSLSFNGSINVSAIGSLICFLGFLLTESKKEKTKLFGDMLLGFGFVFIGIKIMTSAMESFYGYKWFLNFFLIKSPPIILLNGFFITALCQSSSVVTSMLVILASSQVVSVENAIYMILGANIGSCISVILASSKMSLAAKRTAVFNLVFNALGAGLFFVIMLVFGKNVESIMINTSQNAGSAVANFHTFFNVFVGVLALPFITPLCKLVCKILPERKEFSKKVYKKTT